MICTLSNIINLPVRPRRRGSILIYSLILMVILFGMVSLAVDYGRLQMIKTQMQRNADVTARGTLQMYVSDGGYSIANAYAGAVASNTYNPVDANSGVAPTVSITWGYWTAATKTFTAGSGSPLAVQVTISRSKQNGNPVPITFPLLNGSTSIRTTCDVWATATAVLTAASSTTTTVAGTADIWLSGMPAGSNAGWSDSPANAAPVMAMNVTPGTTLTFGATGKTAYSGINPTFPPDGAGYNTSHMAGSPDGNYNGLQNGIQTLTAPQNALIGVFLSAAQPSTQTPAATSLDFGTVASQNESNYNGMLLQQPFFIGDGLTSTSTAQTFIVPPGATRLYLGVFDGWQNWDNPGSLTVTTTQQPQIVLVK